MRQAEIYRKDVLAGILTEDGGDIHDSNSLFTQKRKTATYECS